MSRTASFEPMSARTPTRRRVLLGAAALSVLSATRLGAVGQPDVPDEDLVGELRYHLTDGETTLLDLAVEENVGILAISAANPGIDVWVPGAEMLITLPTRNVLPDAPREGIVINKAELRLYHFEDSGVVTTYAIGIGRDGFETPVGATKIVRKAEDPSWYPTANTRADRPDLPAVVGPGPDNPLGDRALYLGWPTYLIHGTNTPYGVGRRVSRGCIRMYPEGVRRLFEKVPVGTPVTVVDQPVKTGWSQGELYLEVYPDITQLDELESTYSFAPATTAPDGSVELIRAAAGPEINRIDWKLARRELIARRGIPVLITRPREQAGNGGAWQPGGQSAPGGSASRATPGGPGVPTPGSGLY